MTAFTSPLPSSADLAAFRRQFGKPETGHTIPHITLAHPALGGAWPSEIDSGIGHTCPPPMPVAHYYGTDALPCEGIRSKASRIRSADYAANDFAAGAGQLSDREIEWWYAASETFVPEYGSVADLAHWIGRQDAPHAEQDDSADSSAPLARCLPSVDLDVVRALQFCELDASAVAY